MKVLCTICARGGSVGVKNKNIRQLCGKPLIAHSLRQAKQSTLFDLIAVSSDSAAIRQIASEWEADQVIERPAALALSTSPKLPVIQHALLQAENFYGDQFDFIIDLDATSPLRSVEDIVTAFKLFVAHKNATNLVTASPAHRSPYFNMLEILPTGYAALVKHTDTIICRRQDTPACYDMNASIYIWKRDTLLESNHVITDNTLLYVMPKERSFDIDSLLDWQIVSMLAKKRKDFANESLSAAI